MKNEWLKYNDRQKKEIFNYCEGYKKFISDCKTERECVAEVIRQAVEAFGGIDVLVNNAQASASGVTLADHTLEQFDLALYSGLYATFHYMQAAYPYLKEAKGSVINFASGAGFFGNFGQSAYAAAKEGIRGLSRVAATEWARDGINVNVIAPLACIQTGTTNMECRGVVGIGPVVSRLNKARDIEVLLNLRPVL